MPSKRKKSVIKKKGDINKGKSFNPFEVRVNRKKRNVLGQQSKCEVGKPGISRSKSIQKRKKTLLQEYRLKNKSNQLVDRRFGEKDPTLSMEEKLMQRFVTEKKRKQERSGRFNLTEDNDTLTHYGQSIGEMTSFDYVALSDKEEENEDFSEANFGGFMKKKRPRSNDEEEEKEEQDPQKTRKQILNEIVAKSKHMKYERQSEKMEMENLMLSVDTDWKAVHGLISSSVSKEEEEVSRADDYDRAVRELQFERRGQALDRLKTEEELAVEEKERLEKLEADRLRRMKGLRHGVAGSEDDHVSGDFMRDPGLQKKKRDTRVTLRYSDGKAVVALSGGTSEEQSCEVRQGDDEVEKEAEDGEVVEEDGEEDEEVEEESDVGVEGDSSEEVEEERSDGDSEEEAGRTGGRCGFGSDLDSEADEDLKGEESVVGGSAEELPQSNSVSKEASRKAASLELPFTFAVPKTLKEFRSIVEGRSPSECLTALQRIHSCNHPSLSSSNKKHLEQFLPILLDFCVELCEDPLPENSELLEKAFSPLYQLCKLNSANTSSVFQKALSCKYEKWSCKKTKFPCLSTLYLLQLVGVVFSVSDFKHPVATPAMQFMGQVLCKSLVRSKSDLLHGLLVCGIMLKYVSESKRLIPELVNFLTGTLGCLCEPPTGCTFLPPFSNKVVVCEPVEDADEIRTNSPRTLPQLVASCYCDTSISLSASKQEILSRLLDLILKTFQLYKNLSSFPELFLNLVSNLSKVATSLDWPAVLKEKLESTVDTYRALAAHPRSVLTMLKQKPKSINFYEPKFDVNYEPDRRKHRGKSGGERQKLQYKLKKELKGAVREIRRDTAFLAKVKLDETMKLDADRKRKTRQLLNELQGQQHEAKMEKRTKKK